MGNHPAHQEGPPCGGPAKAHTQLGLISGTRTTPCGKSQGFVIRCGLNKSLNLRLNVQVVSIDFAVVREVPMGTLHTSFCGGKSTHRGKNSSQ